MSIGEISGERNPEHVDIENPLFQAIWDKIKTWDVKTPDNMRTGTSGNHACAILDAVTPLINKAMEHTWDRAIEETQDLNHIHDSRDWNIPLFSNFKPVYDTTGVDPQLEQP